MIKSLHKHLLAAGLLAGLGLAAVAQTPAPAPATDAPARTFAHRGDPAKMQERQARRQEMRQIRMERRLAELKLKLQVSGAQEGAWNAWTAAMKPPQRQRMDRAEIMRLSTPERIDRMSARRAERSAEMERRGAATKAFYSALNADQQKVFDGESLRFGKGKRGGRGHRRGGEHRHHG